DAVIRRRVKLLDFAGEGLRKPVGVEQAARRRAPSSRQYRAPRRRNIVADRCDQAQTGDCHPSLRFLHVGSLAANSTRAVATDLPATFALSMTRAASAS